jgi:hypothetical protein
MGNLRARNSHPTGVSPLFLVSIQNHPATIKTFPDLLKDTPAFDWLIVQYNP